jgi:hypothetical protein
MLFVSILWSSIMGRVKIPITGVTVVVEVGARAVTWKMERRLEEHTINAIKRRIHIIRDGW